MKNIDTKNIKGVFDYTGKEELIRNKIKEVLKTNFEKYGYESLETSILYNYDLLAHKYDEDAEILKEMYTLTDQGNRKLALRYDLTMPFCKVIANKKDLRLPFKRYEMGPVFRNGPVKTGRNREFYQCDADVVGLSGPSIEVEQFQLVVDTFNQLGIDIIIKWNNRKFMSGLISYCNVKDKDIEKCISILDKLEKITKEELILEFKKIDLHDEEIENLMHLFNLSLEEYNDKFKDVDNDLIKEGLKEINELNNYIIELDLKDSTCFTPTLARGLSIYTGVVYEFFDKQKRLTCSLGGGGRYDKIITEFISDGREYPAIGLSFGLEPIYNILKEIEDDKALVDVYIIPLDTTSICLKLARLLRNNNIKTLVELNNRKVKKCFEYASKEKIKYVIVVGSDELEDNLYTIKNMDTGIEEKLTVEEIVDKLRKK